MSYSYQIASEHKLVYARIEGAVDGTECAAAVRQLFADDAWSPDYDVLWDGRLITQLVLDPDDFDTLLHTVADRMEGRDALVVERVVDIAAAELYAVLARRREAETRVFQSIKEALEYLGRPRLPESISADDAASNSSS